MQILKRDGSREEFDPSKIKTAIKKAFKATGYKGKSKDIQDIAADVASKCFDGISVEEIQDLVVKHLEGSYRDVALNYSTYRNQKAELRAASSDKFYDAIKSIIEEKENDVTKENSNRVTNEIATKMQLIGEETCKNLFQTDPDIQDVVKAHNKGIIHVHDTAYWGLSATNCGLLNINDILQNGTVINGVQINKPHSLQVATTIITQVLSKVRKDQYGGMTFSISDLSPFVRMDHDNLLKEALDYGLTPEKAEDYLNGKLAKSVTAAIQTLNYQITTLSDDIFVSVSLDVYDKKEYEKETAMLIKEILLQRIKGLPDEKGQYVTQTFPKLLFFTYDNMFDKGDKYYPLLRLAAESTAKRMAPDFMSSKISHKYKDCNVPVMGCRSGLQPWLDKNGDIQIWGRGNLGVVTLNLPYIELENKFNGEDTLNGFKQQLRKYFRLALKAHRNRITRVVNSRVDVAPLLWMYGVYSRAESGTLIKDIVKDGYFTASMGYVGLAETVEALGTHYVTPEGQKLGLKILKYLNELCEEARRESPLHVYYSIYGTPMESSVKKFANSIKSFPLIPHVNDRNYITNSYHIPVEHPIDIFSKFDFEAPFQEYSTGGAISYGEAGNLEKNIDAVMEILRTINDEMLYAEINIRHSDVCHVCGYHGEIKFVDGKWTCPNCGNTDIRRMSRVRRSCGYLSSNDWNTARTDEIVHRVIHIQ